LTGVFEGGFGKRGVQNVVICVVEAYKIVVEAWWLRSVFFGSEKYATKSNFIFDGGVD